MKNVIGKSWRDAATLIVLTKRSKQSLSRGGVNYEILLQTRTGRGAFPNSVVFPGGVTEDADEDDRWLQLFSLFGYTNTDLESLHHANGPITPILQKNPIRRHISLRITAIRETFEELGILLCSQQHKKQKDGLRADFISNIDVKTWQDRVSKNPESLWNLCEDYKCYPDIWSLHYWSNWLTPATLPKRFNTAFFVTALEEKPELKNYSTEVAFVKWSDPTEILNSSDVKLYPPQTYELTRLSHVKDLDELIEFAKRNSCYGHELVFPVYVKVADGILQILPGDDLYPSDVNDNNNNNKYIDKTILELRENCKTIHRAEYPKSKDIKPVFVIRNYKPYNHIDMGDRTITLQKN